MTNDMKPKIVVKHFKIKDKRQQALFMLFLEQQVRKVNEICIEQARRAN